MWGWSIWPNALNMSAKQRPAAHLKKLPSRPGLDLWRKNKPARWDAQHSNLSWNLSLGQTEQGIHNRNYHLSLRIAVKQALLKSLGWQNGDKTFNKHWNVLARSLAFFLCRRGQPFIQGHGLMWISERLARLHAYATSVLKSSDGDNKLTKRHFPMNGGVFSQVWKHKGRQHATAPQYSCIASSFPFTKRQCDEKRLIRDKNDLIRVSRYNGCQIELQRLTPALRLITVLQYRYSTNDVRVRADARLSLDEWSLQQVQTHMESHPNHICNGSLTIRSECNGVARFTPTLITGNYEQRLFASLLVVCTQN